MSKVINVPIESEPADYIAETKAYIQTMKEKLIKKILASKKISYSIHNPANKNISQ